MFLKIMTVALFFSPLFATAQLEKIDTDRPDQTESAFTIPVKWVQAEIGFQYASERYNKLSPREQYFIYPTLLTKYGLTKHFELRLITEYSGTRYLNSNGKHEVEKGFNSVQLGGKLNLLEEKGGRPKTSLIAHYDFGRLRTPYRYTTDGLNFRFTMQHTISPLISLGYNLGMQWEAFGQEPACVYTFAPGFNISEKWYAYAELFGSIWKNYHPENSVDAGIAYYVNNNLKIDASAGLGLSKNAQDLYIGMGASFRFKTGK